MSSLFPAGLKTVTRTFILGIPVGITLIDFIGYVAKVEGHSMQPLLNPENPESKTYRSDYVFLFNWPIATNQWGVIERGDIVAFISPRNPRQRLIKRVIGLQGDIIDTKGYYKPYVEVPAGHCWVEGENRGHTLDSNTFGPVPLGLLKSKAQCIVWPPGRIGSLNKTVADDRIPLNANRPSGTKEKVKLNIAQQYLLSQSQPTNSSPK